MQARWSERLAIHIGPEPCVCLLKEAGEASGKECKGFSLIRERTRFLNADAVALVDGQATRPLSRRGQRPRQVQRLLVREPGNLQTDLGDKYLPRSASERRGAEADDVHLGEA